jgi:murein DD-endopeptidase MepM/ murein hydrolase activator NlpD
MSAFAWFHRVRGVAGAPSIVLPVAAVVAVALSLLIVSPAASAEGDDGSSAASRTWTWPLAPRPAVLKPFDPPDAPYGAGNRGVDLAGSVAQTVLAISGGVVTYAGVLAGRGVVVVSHGALRSTYEPVSAAVAVGDNVSTGQSLGALSAVGSQCTPDACLHLGVLRGTEYVDPLSLLGDPPIRLKPMSDDSALPAPTSAVGDAAIAAAGYPWPVVR